MNLSNSISYQLGLIIVEKVADKERGEFTGSTGDFGGTGQSDLLIPVDPDGTDRWIRRALLYLTFDDRNIWNVRVRMWLWSCGPR